MDIWGAIISSTIGGFTGALCAYLLNRWHWKRLHNIERLMARCSRVVLQIDHIEKASMQYWLTEEFAQQSNKKALEIEIKSKLSILIKMINKLLSICGDKFSASDSLKVHELKIKLYDKSTGSSFESLSKTTEPELAFEINNICSELKLLISEIND